MLLNWLRLFRIAGLTTLLSNILAVLVTTGLSSVDIAREIMQNAPDALWVGLASVFIYLAGMIWNDVADVERDAEINPRRPLPSGRVGYGNAWLAGVVCAVLAMLCAAQLGWRGFYSASVVLSLALLYDFGLKSVPWLGSVFMAATRASHACFALLMLGSEHFDLMMLSLLNLFQPELLIADAGLGYYPLLLALYIFGLTLISELEHRRSYRWELLVGAGCMAASLLLVIIHNFLTPELRDLLVERQITAAGLTIGATGIIGVWAIWRLTKALLPAIRLAQRNLIGPFMIRGLSGIIIFDTLVIIGFRPELAPLALFLLIPFALLGRMARMD